MGVSGPAPPPPPGSPEPTAGTGPARRPPLSPPARCSPPAAHGRTCRSTVLGVTFTVWRRPFGASTDTAEPPPPAGAAMFRPRDPPPPPAQLQTTLSVTAGTDSHAAAGRSRRALPDTPGPRPARAPPDVPGPPPVPAARELERMLTPTPAGCARPAAWPRRQEEEGCADASAPRPGLPVPSGPLRSGLSWVPCALRPWPLQYSADLPVPALAPMFPVP